MTAIWNKIEELANELEKRFDRSGEAIEGTLDSAYDWHNTLWRSYKYRRAHIEIVDKRESKGIYILHSTIFPHFNDPSPIWGFDAICGRSKITGAFHDFSAAGDSQHPILLWFQEETRDLNWTKPRELPDWARQIFSPAAIAAGNISDIAEVDLLCNIALRSLDYYLEHVGKSQQDIADYHMAQNRYCHYQKQNPQVIKSMIAMGVEESTIRNFVDEVLFPEHINIQL